MNILLIIQLIVAVLLIGAIMLQSRGTGLGAAFGGEGNVYRTKRGLEKSLFRATIALATLFLGSALAITLLNPTAPPAAPVEPTAADDAADDILPPENEPANGTTTAPETPDAGP